MGRVFITVLIGIVLIVVLPGCVGTQPPEPAPETEPEIIWQKALGGFDVDVAYSVQQTTDGGYIVAGFTKSNDGDVTGNHGSADFWVVKLGWQ
ncbi:hypothetical protein TRQ7_06965 [Thermotoga sp. RQ7]|uniref:hypothetical protein n=1 Tax=Thermotoga sp. RQ7 TaxID=126738 RepID=UPI0005A322BE